MFEEVRKLLGIKDVQTKFPPSKSPDQKLKIKDSASSEDEQDFTDVIFDAHNEVENLKDTEYATSGTSYGAAVSLGGRSLGASKGMMGRDTTSTFDYLSNAENTPSCFYQKLEDLAYYESHALTEKIIGIYRDYISQLWKDVPDMIDIPGESPEVIKEINLELQAMGIREVLMKDLSTAIFYGSVSYEISDANETDPIYTNKTPVDKPENLTRYKYARGLEKPKAKESKFSSEESFFEMVTRLKDSKYNAEEESNLDESGIILEPNSTLAKVDSISKSPEVREILDNTSGKDQRGQKEADERKKLDTHKLNTIAGHEGYQGDWDNMPKSTTYEPKFKLNKVKFPHSTIVEYDRKEGRRYLIKATERYHIPSNKHQIFYYGYDNMRIVDETNRIKRIKGNKKGSQPNSINQDLLSLIGGDKGKRYKKLGIDPQDPKKTPSRYELMEKEMSAGAPLFYYLLPKVKELYLKDIVVSILGIKDVIQPDILGMNFEGGTNIDHAQDLASNMEKLLNKSSDYSIFNSSVLDYNDLVKLLIDTVRVLPDIDGKLQGLNPIRTTSLQEKVQQIRSEIRELENDIVSSLGVPLDLFEGQSTKWEVIKRSERLQSRVTYYTDMMKGSIRRIAQSVFYRMYDRELKPSDFNILTFTESDLEIAQKTNKLSNISELSGVILNTIISAERELQESAIINKEAYFKFLITSLKDVYPDIDNVIDLESYLSQSQEGGQSHY